MHFYTDLIDCVVKFTALTEILLQLSTKQCLLSVHSVIAIIIQLSMQDEIIH